MPPMATKCVHEIAKERGITSKETLEVLRHAGLDVKFAASRVEEADADGAFGSAPARRLPPRTPPPPEPQSQAQPHERRPRIRWDDFLARVEAEQPEHLPVEEVARVWPPPWFTRNGSGKLARIRLPVGEQKYERKQGEHHWRRVGRWTMGPPR
jgi:hypothetical protein